jgi:hypothetical protein
VDRDDVPEQDTPREVLTWELVDALEKVLDLALTT